MLFLIVSSTKKIFDLSNEKDAIEALSMMPTSGSPPAHKDDISDYQCSINNYFFIILAGGLAL